MLHRTLSNHGEYKHSQTLTQHCFGTELTFSFSADSLAMSRQVDWNTKITILSY